MKRKTVEGFGNLSLSQFLGSVISVAGNILLARLLGLEMMGLYAVSAFFTNFIIGFSMSGINTFLIRKPGDLSHEYAYVGLTLNLIYGITALFIVVTVLAPLVSYWYGHKELYGLLSLSFIGLVILSCSKVSQAFLERQLEYGKVGFIEVLGMASFYTTAVVCSYCGLGVFSIAIGELSRGISSVLSFKLAGLKFKLLWKKEIVKEVFQFCSSFASISVTWGINLALNPIIVGKIVGLEAAGIIRVAEGIVAQTSFFRAITERMFYPLVSKLQTDKENLIKAVEKAQIIQLVLGSLPLFVFTSMGFYIIPLLYGNEWYKVSNVLPLYCLSSGVSSIFTAYSFSLVIKGQNLEVAKFSTLYAILILMVSPITAHLFGYMGLPIAGIIVLPSYYILYRSFRKIYGAPNTKNIFVLLMSNYAAMGGAWFIKDIFLSPLCFLCSVAITFLLLKPVRHVILDELTNLKTEMKFFVNKRVVGAEEPRSGYTE